MATLTFLGAAQQVTGSCYLIDTGRHRILLECGIRQGEDKLEGEEEHSFPFDPGEIDAVILSHTHLDHSGRVPLLVNGGFRGPVYATQATVDLLPIMYQDAASLLLSDIERKNRRLQRAGRPGIEPPYTLDDVEQALAQTEGVEYRARRQLFPEVEVCFREAGHILGSAIVEIWLESGGQRRKLVFSGDLGNADAPLMRDPEIIAEADILLLESTYGDRNHRPIEETLGQFLEVLGEVSQGGGNILIPAFAVGRTQDMIYWLGRLYREGRLNNRKVFIDSPMAIRVSGVYERHIDLFNRDHPAFNRFMEEGWDNWLPGLTYTRSPEESMMLNRITDGAVIIAGSGMCSGGRILHHLKHNLWRDKTHLVIVGFQAYGTLGRALVDGASRVRIFGDEIAVKAKIHTLGGFSAHAGQDQLLQWVGNFEPRRPRLYLIHGELQAMRTLQRRLVLEQQWDAHIPCEGEVINL